MEDKHWVNVFTIYDFVKAGAIESALKEKDIPVSVYHYRGSSVYSVYSPVVGKGEIRVPEDYVDKVKTIIADFEKE